MERFLEEMRFCVYFVAIFLLIDRNARMTYHVSMEKEIRVGIMLIENLMDVSVTIASVENEDIRIPSLYLEEKEKEVIQGLIKKMPDKSLCFMKDSLNVCYCIMHIKSHILMIGPYKNQDEKNVKDRKAFLQQTFHDSELENQFVTEYEKLVQLEDSKIKNAAHTFILGVYGNVDDIAERKIELRRYMNELGIDTTEVHDWRVGRTFQNIIDDKELQFQLIDFVERGNFKSAIEVYKELVKNRIPEQGLGPNALEGLTTVRNLMEIAMHNAGVPITAYAKLARTHQLKSRGIRQKKDGESLGIQFISDSCDLVRQYSTMEYSTYVSLAVDYIHQNLNEPFCVEDIAGEIGISVSRLSTLFHEEVGKTISGYTLEVRMTEAAKLLVFTNLSVQTIATKVGIPDNNYFARCFKKHFQITPTEYRKKRILP